MKYMGSKNRHAKEMLPIILKDHTEDMWYIEPFVGGANMIDKVPFDKRIGCDINEYLIQALTSIRDNLQELPKTNKDFTERDYKLLRKSDSYRYKGYAGFAFSYSGKWLGGGGVGTGKGLETMLTSLIGMLKNNRQSYKV